MNNLFIWYKGAARRDVIFLYYVCVPLVMGALSQNKRISSNNYELEFEYEYECAD